VTSVLFTSSLGGYVFSRLRFPGRRLVFYFALSTIMVPFITLFVPLYVVFARLGLADSYVGLWLPSAISSIGIFLCRQFMYSIPTELYDAAKIDGAGEWTVYWRIVLPLIKPALAVVGIFTFLGAFNNYLWPLVLINNQSLYTLPLVLANNINGLGITNYQLLMAGAVLASVPTVIVFLLFQRYIMRGIALTGGNY
jgi:multiple sugar transport system permease protein